MPPVRLFGKFVNVNEDPARATPVPEGNAESHLLKPGRSTVNTDGPTCRDPTILNRSEPSHGGVAYLEGTGGCVEKNSVASDRALDAKLNIDEALISFNSKSSRKSSETLFLDTVRDSGKITPESGCKEKNSAKTLNVSTLSEEEAGSVETASAAVKRAETLDALIKAAKLVADAVSHAGTILSKGEPLPLTLAELLEACADGYWKGQQVSSEILSTINKKTEGEKVSLVGDGVDRNVQPLIEKETEGRDEELHSQESKIKKGSLVEVQTYTDSFKGIWFPAKVLNLHDGKAYVHYSISFRVEGNSHGKEWVSLTEESGKPPKIRLAQITTAINYEGTQNRRRDARGDHTWCTGDRVEALICNGWLEGVIKERTNGNETYYTIQFPARGDTFNIQAFNLRPSLIWKDDHWMERSSSMGTICYSSEGDTSHHKRVKLGNHDAVVEARGKNKLKHIGHVESQEAEALRPLALSAKEKLLTVGKKITENKSFDTIMTKQTGCQKEGSGVVFDAPEYDKNTQFVEMRKYCGANSGVKCSLDNGTIKFSENAICQEPESSGLNKAFKVDTKGKRVVGPSHRALTKRKITSSVEADAVTKGRFASSGKMFASKEVKEPSHNNDPGKLVSDASEPRRSHCKIQPTTRLLEGLETSFFSRTPAVSDGKGTKENKRS